METTPEEQNRLLSLLVTYFTEQWLTDTSENGIQELWQRDDLISTQELLSLATAIEKMLAVDKSWTDGQIKIAKSKEKNIARGAWFEICALSYLVSENYSVTPTKANNPGIDAVLEWSDNSKIMLSLKRFDISTHEINFRNKMELIEDVLKSSLSESGIIGAICRVIFNTYPSDSAFKSVADRIPLAIKQMATRPFTGITMQCPDGNIGICIVPLQSFDLSEKHNSYQLIAVCKLHDNEFKNLTDKLDKTCTNLHKHANREESKVLNGVLVHMHESAAMESCRKHIVSYLNQISNNPIGFVWLYKPSLTRDDTGSNTIWSHVFMDTCDESLMKNWNKIGGKFPKFTVQYGGAFSTIDITQTILADNVMGTLEDVYTFQKGKIYVNATVSKNGEVCCDLSHPAPGIHVCRVIKDTLNMKEEERLTISGRFADYESLTIL
jgi:predicted metal-dependent hydrolase